MSLPHDCGQDHIPQLHLFIEVIGDGLGEIDIRYHICIDDQEIFWDEVSEPNFPHDVSKAASFYVYLLSSVGFM